MARKLIVKQEDMMLTLPNSISASPQSLKLRIEVLDSKENIVGTIEGIVEGSMSISATSDVRRTCNFTLTPTLVQKIKLDENNLIWIDKDIRLFVSLHNIRTHQYVEYPLGYYVYTSTSCTYDESTNQLSIDCSDFITKLDGTKNGQLGALNTKYPAYEENPDTGEVIKYNIIRDAVITTLTSLARISKYMIDDIGEYKAMPQYNSNWQEYREEHKDTWNTIPYDQEFECGCNVLEILTTFRDLYPNYEMFFNMEDNTFVCQMIPSCYDDDLFIDNDFIQKVLISEDSSVDMTTVRNICEVWGEVFETDYYTESCSYSNNIYSCTIDGYDEKYCTGDIVSIKIPSENQSSPNLNINNLGTLVICDENTELPIQAKRMKANNIYTFKIKRKYENHEAVFYAYLLGQWQVHAINVLSNGTGSNKTVTASDGTVYKLYSKEYFKKFYNCERVDFEVIQDSPFAIEKIGEILDVKSDGEYENITSDDLAAARAKYENWKNCRLTDNITITTTFLPFLDVNKKVSYKSMNSDETQQYIIESVSHDFTSCTSTIEMYRFYPLYQENDETKIGTHETLSQYTHKELSSFTYKKLSQVI